MIVVLIRWRAVNPNISLRSPVSTVLTVIVTTPPACEADDVGEASAVAASLLLDEPSASMGVSRYLRALSFIWIVRRMSHCVMVTVFVEKPAAPMLVSARSRAPLIIVVLSLDCPATVVLIVILNSPVFVLSSGSLRCAEPIAEINETPTIRTENRNVLDFMKYSGVNEFFWGTRRK